MTFMTSPLGEPSGYLAMRRFVPDRAEIWQLVLADDADGIRHLISNGLASPMDAELHTGRAPLHVSFANSRIPRV